MKMTSTQPSVQMISKKHLAAFIKLEKIVAAYTDSDMENGGDEIQNNISEYARQVERFDSLGVSIDGYCEHHNLQRK